MAQATLNKNHGHTTDLCAFMNVVAKNQLLFCDCILACSVCFFSSLHCSQLALCIKSAKSQKPLGCVTCCNSPKQKVHCITYVQHSEKNVSRLCALLHFLPAFLVPIGCYASKEQEKEKGGEERPFVFVELARRRVRRQYFEKRLVEKLM